MQRLTFPAHLLVCLLAGPSALFAQKASEKKTPPPRSVLVKIQELEKELTRKPGAFNWGLHNELRHCYGAFDERKAYYHCDVILKHTVMCGYTLDILSGWENQNNRAKAMANLLQAAGKYPEFKYVKAACLIKAGDHEEDGARAADLYCDVMTMRDPGLADYRQLAAACLRQIGAKKKPRAEGIAKTPPAGKPAFQASYLAPKCLGRFGEVLFENTTASTITLTLWHPNSGQPQEACKIKSGEIMKLTQGRAISFGDDWGVQIDGSGVKPLAAFAHWDEKNRTFHASVDLFRGLPSFLHGLATGIARKFPVGNKYAVVIGISTYTHKKLLNDLPFSSNDALQLAESLQKSAYQVTLITDTADLKPTRDIIEEQLRKVLENKKSTDFILIAFAGHGLEVEGDPYLCPRDAVPPDPNGPEQEQTKDKSTLVSLNEIYRKMGRSNAGAIVLLLDACRKAPQGRKVADPAKLILPRNVGVIFSCQSRKEAFEHPELKHGVFFHAVLKALNGEVSGIHNQKGELTFARLAEYLAEAVPAKAKDLNLPAQVPNSLTNFEKIPVLASLLTDLSKSNVFASKDKQAPGTAKIYDAPGSLKMSVAKALPAQMVLHQPYKVTLIIHNPGLKSKSGAIEYATQGTGHITPARQSFEVDAGGVTFLEFTFMMTGSGEFRWKGKLIP